MPETFPPGHAEKVLRELTILRDAMIPLRQELRRQWLAGELPFDPGYDIREDFDHWRAWFDGREPARGIAAPAPGDSGVGNQSTAAGPHTATARFDFSDIRDHTP